MRTSVLSEVNEICSNQLLHNSKGMSLVVPSLDSNTSVYCLRLVVYMTICFYILFNNSVISMTVGDCGRRGGSTRIVGGDEATAHAWPWQASLRSSGWMGSSHICGATIINEEWLVTAAHCVDGLVSSILTCHFVNCNSLLVILYAGNLFLLRTRCLASFVFGKWIFIIEILNSVSGHLAAVFVTDVSEVDESDYVLWTLFSLMFQFLVPPPEV